MDVVVELLFCCLTLIFISHKVYAEEKYKDSGSEVYIRIPRGRLPKVIRGRPGEPGPPGPPGDDGNRGAQGLPGVKGFPGPQGPKGFQGAPGSRGSRGLKGDAGKEGPPGIVGIPGKCIRTSSNMVCLEGPTGRQGIKGSQGIMGSQGQKGLQGSQGPKGKQGKKGRRGARGFPGLPGSVGGPNCTARYTNWVEVSDFVKKKQGMMCGDMEFLWNVVAESESNKLRYRFHCCEFLQVGIF